MEMPTYLTNVNLWLDIIFIPIFAAFIAFILIFLVVEKKEDYKKVFIVIFSMALLGMTAGQLTGQSREPAVGAVIPAVLTFIGGLLIYIITTKNEKFQSLVSITIISFSLTLLVGTFWGSQLRHEFEVNSRNQQAMLYNEYILQQVRLEKLKNEKQIQDARKLLGLKDKNNYTVTISKCEIE